MGVGETHLWPDDPIVHLLVFTTLIAFFIASAFSTILSEVCLRGISLGVFRIPGPNLMVRSR